MSKQFRFAFIVMSRGFDPSQNHAMMEVDSCKAVLVGVDRLDQACAAAQHLISTGEVDRIELCGAFGEELAKLMHHATGEMIPVGYVKYPKEQERSLQIFWES